MGAKSRVRDPRPNRPMPDFEIFAQFEHCHVDTVVEDYTEGARLSSTPAKTLNVRVLLVEGPRPLLATSIVGGRSDSLIQAESPSCYTDEVDERDPGAKPGKAHSPRRPLIDRSGVTEGFRHRSDQRGRGVPYRSAGDPRMMIEPETRQRSDSSLAVPRAVLRIVEADELSARTHLVQRGLHR